MSSRSAEQAGEPVESVTEQGEAAEWDPGAVRGEYTWRDYFDEYDPAASRLEPSGGVAGDNGTFPWKTSVDLDDVLGFSPGDPDAALEEAIERAVKLDAATYDTLDPDETPVTKGAWSWHHFVRACVDPDWSEPSLPAEFEPDDHLGGFGVPVENRLAYGHSAAETLADLIDERTVDVQPDLDEDAFFRTTEDVSTIVSRYDLEKAVPMEKKTHFREVERYWVNKPDAFVTIFHSEKENETKYYLIEPHLTPIEDDVFAFLTGKLRTSIKYADDIVSESDEPSRREVIETETLALLDRYDIFEEPDDSKGIVERARAALPGRLGGGPADDVESKEIHGMAVRPEPSLVEENRSTLTGYQVEKLLYQLIRDFIGYQRIDGIKHDINVEDISCDGYNSPVFVYHTEYEQIISNIEHGRDRLDDFVVKLAQRSGKGISKRQPQVDVTLPDGSRGQLTLGKEVSDHGTNYTIRQFNDVPFTPIDLINWRTFSLEQMAFLWLCIESHKSVIFAGGTASGKTTSLNAVSLFIPSASKIVSIEDTREVELPQRNWIASVTRPSFSDDEKGDVDEFDLLEAALRQRPEYIVMGEIRGEEGRTLFQVMSTGHTTYTTFHADSVGEVLKRFTTDPINVSKTMFTALDLVAVQTQTRVHGRKVRRNKSLTEINHFDTENDEINVQDIYQWEAESDEFRQIGSSNTLDQILFDRGWSRERLESELFKREVVLAYLIQNGLNQYQQVAATIQAFIADSDTTMGLIANDTLRDNLEDLREMESVLIDIDPEKEALVPRPDPDAEMRALTASILDRAEDELFDEYESNPADSLSATLDGQVERSPIVVEPDEEAEPEPNIDGDEIAEADTDVAGEHPWDSDASWSDQPDETDSDGR